MACCARKGLQQVELKSTSPDVALKFSKRFLLHGINKSEGKSSRMSINNLYHDLLLTELLHIISRLQMDVTDKESILKVKAYIEEKEGKLHVLVNKFVR